MKIVMVLALVSIISYHASAQKAAGKSGVSKTAVAKKPAQKAKTPKKTVVAGSVSETTAPSSTESETLTSEADYQAKSRFHWMLAKRIQIDAEDNSNEGALRQEQQRKASAPASGRKTSTATRSEATREVVVNHKEKSAP